MNVKEPIYDEKISPLMTEIIRVCKENHISMVASFELDIEDGYEPDDPLLCTTQIIEKECVSQQLKEAAKILAPESVFMLAETIETKPDGTKHITIKRIT